MSDIVLWRNGEKTVRFELNCSLAGLILHGKCVGAFDEEGTVSGSLTGYALVPQGTKGYRVLSEGMWQLSNGSFSFSPPVEESKKSGNETSAK